MCIAILQPNGKKLTEEQIDNCWFSNPDFAGIAFVNEKNIIEIHKYTNLIDFKNYYDLFVEQYGNTSQFIIHFRIATHGTVNLNNTHPFYVSKDVVFCHNGILDIDIPKKYKKQDFSDTRYFNESILKQLPKNFMYNPAILQLLEHRIDDYNKMIFLNAKKNYVILNEKLGIWDDGIWFSNTSYKSKPIKSSKTNELFLLDYSTEEKQLIETMRLSYDLNGFDDEEVLQFAYDTYTYDQVSDLMEGTDPWALSKQWE